MAKPFCCDKGYDDGDPIFIDPLFNDFNEPGNLKKKPIFGGKKNRSALLVDHYNEYDLI